MGEKKYDVVSVGLQCIDLVCAPVSPDLMRREMTEASSVRMMLGGDALNQALTLAALGARVGLIGLVGNDRLGDVLLDRLAKVPLTVLSRRADVNTAISVVLVEPNGERHFVYQPESNNALSLEHIDTDAVRDAEFLSVGGCLLLPGLDGEGMLRLLDIARDAGARTAADFCVNGSRPDADALRALLSRIDYALPSRVEAEELVGPADSPAELAERLRGLGATNCVIKLGAEGCYVAADGFEGMVPAYPCRCVDATGAGDTFVGAFLYAKTRGWDVGRCARFACAAGSIAVEHPGANGAIHSAGQVLLRMEQ